MTTSNPVNVEEILINLGVPEEKAKSLNTKMNGNDYLDLVNALTDPKSNGRKHAEQILGRYGIKLANKVTNMENTRLESIFHGLKSGKQFDEAEDMAFVRPISEMDSIAAQMSGFSNFVRASNDRDADTLRDWLEENEMDYQNNDKLTFLVQHADREKAYRLNRFMGTLNGKDKMVDDLEENLEEKWSDGASSSNHGARRLADKLEREANDIRRNIEGYKKTPSLYNAMMYKYNMKMAKYVMAAFNAGMYGNSTQAKRDYKDYLETAKQFKQDSSVVEEKNKNMAKDEMPAKRNPFAAHAIKKGGAGAHNSKDPSRRDAWSRNAKHKKSQVDESAFSQGETVGYNGEEYPVHINNGPNSTIGLLIDGRVRMVKESEVTRIDEGILGMTKIDPLYRLRELAGVKSNNPIVEDEPAIAIAGDDFDIEDDTDDTMGPDMGDDMAFDTETGDLGGDLDMGDDMDMGMETDPLAGSVDDMGMDDMGMDDMGMDMGGMPGDLPPTNDMMVAPMDSQAYTEIQDHLNNIQASLGDVKLSEYRSLIAKLEALTVQVRSMGRDYLGEARKLKK
jgi:hypothetical protein